jgi:hypothetical protein
MKKNVLISGFILLSLSCHPDRSGNKDSAVTDFGREDFAVQASLGDPEEIVFEELLNPTAFYLMYDSLAVVQNQPNCEYLIEICSLKDRAVIAQFASKGPGPDEFFSCEFSVHSGADSVLHAIDRQKGVCCIINLPSSLQSKLPEIERRFRYDPEIHPYPAIHLIDSKHYIGRSMWYLNSREYDNQAPALTRYATDAPVNPNAADIMQHKYFVSSVNEACIAVNPSNREIWLLDGHQDKIEIYNDSLQILKTLHGPDRYRIGYTDIKAGAPIPIVTFVGDKTYRAYRNYACTDKHIYVIYEGIHGDGFNPEDLQPVEVFKFDWNGNPLCRYSLDRYVYTVSVDSREEYLYCTARTSYMEEAHFLKYKLK